MNWWSELIQDHHPPVSVFEQGRTITKSELFRFVRIIMTEGIPFACTKFPLAYQFARERAAECLGLDSKQMSLVGSARLGYSLASEKFGKPFSITESDIDVFAVSSNLFNLIVEEHSVFLAQWKRGNIKPRHELQRNFWESYLQTDPNNIRRGFLDATHVPTYNQFPVAQQVGDAAYRFHTNLEAKSGIKIGRKASIRIYKDWESAIRQITFTLKRNLEKRGVPLA